MSDGAHQFDLFGPQPDPPTTNPRETEVNNPADAPARKTTTKRKKKTRSRSKKKSEAVTSESADSNPVQSETTPPTAPALWTVTQLIRRIRATLDEHLPAELHVVGEVSNFVRHGSGHCYFSLKDADGEIRAVMWRPDAGRLKFKPADGLEVVATGRVAVFEKRGQVQFQVRRLEPRGVGALELAFRQMRERLEREGLFDPQHKKKLPAFPQRIAVLTSATGAAVRDILQTLDRRYRAVEVLLHPVVVQGDGAADDVAAAIRRLNAQAERWGGIDLIIVGRGGGSLEDLWAFNEEVLARAIFESRIPIISAVGHETDVTIADFVADARAATPTAAAELAVPAGDELMDRLAGAERRLSQAVRIVVTESRRRLERCEQHEWFQKPGEVLARRGQLLDEIVGRLRLALDRRLAELQRRLHAAEVRHSNQRPAAMIARMNESLTREQYRLAAAVLSFVQRCERELSARRERLQTVSPAHRIARNLDGMSRAEERIGRSLAHRLERSTSALTALEVRLKAAGHDSILKRGFSITRSKRTGKILRSARHAETGEPISTQLSDGEIESTVSGTNLSEGDDERT